MKYEYKNSGIEWLGKIPEHWNAKRLASLGTFSKGHGIPRSDLREDGVPAILYGDIYTKYNVTTGKLINRISEVTATKSTEIKNGDLLLAGSGETKEEIGKCVVYDDVPKAYAGGDIIIFKPIKHDSLFLSYALNSETSIYQKATTAKGDIVVHTYPSKLRSLLIATPPLPEQKAIANYLDKACQRIDNIIAIKQKQLEKIKLIRKSKIDELVCYGIDTNSEIQKTNLNYLPKIKKGWSVDRFKDVAILRNEKTDEKNEKEDYLELEDIEQGTGRILNKRNTIEVVSKVTKFYTGDVLFGKLRPYLEKYYLAEFDGKCTGEILSFKPIRIRGKFLMYLLASKWFIDLCNSMAYGAKMPRVNWPTQLALVNFPVPPIYEKNEIV
jgi:type I restriction enzyme S subunit